MDFYNTCISIKIQQVARQFKMSKFKKTYIVEWGDDEREEFTNKAKAIKYARMLRRAGYRGVIEIEVCVGVWGWNNEPLWETLQWSDRYRPKFVEADDEE